jgi:inner membrane protein
MASIFSHPAVPIGIAMVLGSKRIPKPLLEMGVFACIWADIDCVAFAFGIPYESQFGHRGFTHSIVMAIAFAAVIAWRLPKECDKVTWQSVFPYIFISALSHPLIDMLTDGGLGIALFWPFTAERYFFPVNPVPVSPIGGSFLSARGLEVFSAELGLIWAPCLVLGGLGFMVRKLLEKNKKA